MYLVSAFLPALARDIYIHELIQPSVKSLRLRVPWLSIKELEAQKVYCNWPKAKRLVRAQPGH